MENYNQFKEKMVAQAIPKIIDLYKLCMKEWDLDTYGIGIQDKTIDIAEELLLNVFYSDQAKHWHSLERPRAILVDCNPNATEVKVWLYYAYGWVAHGHFAVRGENDIYAFTDVYRVD